MAFMRVIRDLLLDCARAFHNIALDIEGWPFDFRWVADFFWWLMELFQDIAFDWMHFEDWVNDIAYKVTTFFTELDLDAWFAYWKGLILGAWDWVKDAGWNVYQIIEDWWLVITVTVRGWIDTATQGLDTLKVAWDDFWTVTFPEWMANLDTVTAAWDNFWTVTFPSLVSFDWLDIWWDSRLIELDELINDTIKAWFPFYDDLAELWNGIAEFFIDPLGWIEARFVDWFLGPET